ncbi:DUF2938 domain-containing protein [Limnobacter humi]|uniref:DUF2938 domain-containing protein n=1 Tax=Limnobacter humi TaxID=1778671 RepID=A0ABT1WJK4_9BURK|nr:DUF2938 domain-containing protein [Limnobacter humi]MCQ8897680.1 DUF2938 domain-containing protein [Limnobacter humi]
MNTLHTILHTVTIGLGATGVMDLWLQILKHFNVPTLNFAFIGRWVGHCLRGRFVHAAIGKASPVQHELALGWFTHYATGALFAGLLLAMVGTDWLLAPTATPALLVGLATVVFPFFVMQPAMGLGVASARTPAPFKNRLRSLINHAVFGAGLYIAAFSVNLLVH